MDSLDGFLSFCLTAGTGARTREEEDVGGQACLVKAGAGEVTRGEERLSLHNHI